MTAEELARRLEAEGCNPANYAIGSVGTLSDACYLARHEGTWEVRYTERGRDQPPIFRSESESEACAFYLRHVLAIRHEHCVGFLRAEETARALEAELRRLGLEPTRDRILYRAGDVRHRVFVVGKAIFRAREALGELPVRDA